MKTRTRKKFKKNKSFQFKTLIFLMIFFFVMGWSALPNYFTERFDEQNVPKKPFYVPVRASSTSSNPLISVHTSFEYDADLKLLWRDNATFSHQALDVEVKQLTNTLYDLTFKSDIYTATYRYRIDEVNRKVLPVMYKVTGWIIWFYAIGCLIVATAFITLVQWLIFWWRTSFTKE